MRTVDLVNFSFDDGRNQLNRQSGQETPSFDRQESINKRCILQRSESVGNISPFCNWRFYCPILLPAILRRPHLGAAATKGRMLMCSNCVSHRILFHCFIATITISFNFSLLCVEINDRLVTTWLK